MLKIDVQALDLAKDNKILDLINTVERFTQSLLSNQTCFYLDVAKLAVQCSEKVGTRDGLGFFNLSNGEGYTKSTSKAMARLSL